MGGEERTLLLREELLDRALPECSFANRRRVDLRLQRRRAHVAAGHRVDLHADVRRKTQLGRKSLRVDRPELDHGVSGAPLNPAGASDDAHCVEVEIGRVEEEDLPDLGLERVETELGDRSAMIGGRNRELELDAVGLACELEHLHELLVG